MKFFRPPFGARRPAVFRIAREMGLKPVLWNAMTSDWSEPSAERIAEQLTAKIDAAANGAGCAANIVLHDGGHRRSGGEPRAVSGGGGAADRALQRSAPVCDAGCVELSAPVCSVRSERRERLARGGDRGLDVGVACARTR